MPPFCSLSGLCAPRQPAIAQQVDAYFGLSTARVSSNGQQIDTFGDGTLMRRRAWEAPLPISASTSSSTGNWGLAGHRPGSGLPRTMLVSRITRHSMPSMAFFSLPNSGPRVPLRNYAPASDSQACISILTTSVLRSSSGMSGFALLLVHLAGAARFYVTNHVFLRPAVDVQYVNDFFPFGSNWVPRYSMSVGYSFGRE